MARNRIIKPELFTDEKLTHVSIDARFLFIGLLTFTEDMGRRRYNPARIKYEVFPADDEITPDAVDSFAHELEQVGVVEIYEVSRKRYIRIPHFLDHQYVRKPSHCTAPPSPREGPDALTCLCANCQAREAVNKNGRRRAVASNSLEHHSDLTGDALEPHSSASSEVRVPTGIGIGLHSGKSREAIHTGDSQLADPQPSAKSESSEENRRARYAALVEIAKNILSIFGIDPKPNILDTLTRSIEIRARSKQCTVEAAAQEISARAAWIAGQAEPENWEDWFFDARYAYVPQGDKRLKDRTIEARPVCGGPRCTEGWETVKVGEGSVSRRCPDCVRLWVDTGV